MRRRPSPALVIACLALLVSLSGTGIAAVNALPRGSVGPAQLQTGAVTSLKVRDNSLKLLDDRDEDEHVHGRLPGSLDQLPGRPARARRGRRHDDAGCGRLRAELVPARRQRRLDRRRRGHSPRSGWSYTVDAVCAKVAG